MWHQDIEKDFQTLPCNWQWFWISWQSGRFWHQKSAVQIQSLAKINPDRVYTVNCWKDKNKEKETGQVVKFARLLLRRSEFESCWSLQFFSVKFVLEKNEKHIWPTFCLKRNLRHNYTVCIFRTKWRHTFYQSSRMVGAIFSFLTFVVVLQILKP